MANPSINLGNGNWSVKESKLLGSRPIKDKIAPIEFDVTRASTATRVNKQGFIESLQVVSSNLVSNGDFSQEGVELVTNGNFATDTNWNKGAGWSIENNKALSNGSQTSVSNIQQNNVVTSGKKYEISIEVVSILSGNLKVSLHSVFSDEITLIGTYKFYLNATIDWIRIQASSDFQGSIDNVSVKEVGQDWTFGSGWSIGDSRATQDNSTPNTGDLTQINTTVVGKTYKIIVESEVTSGTVSVICGGHNLINSSGTHTFYKTASSTSIIFRNYSQFVGSITNISVKEITNKINLPRINYEGFSYQGSLGQEVVPNSGYGSLLLEPQSTNLITYSEDLSNMQIAFGGAISLDSSFLNPSGENGSYFIYDTDGGSQARFRVSNSGFTLGDKLSYSVFVKSDSSSSITIGGNYGSENCSFNVGTKTLTYQGTSVNSYEIINFTNGWTRYVVNTTFNNNVGTGDCFPFFTTNATLSEKIYIWGHQLEQNSYATSYIPTLTGTTQTRVAETCGGAGDSSSINSEEGVLYAEIKGLADLVSSRLSINDGTNLNTIQLAQSTTISNNYTFSNASGTFNKNFTVSDITDYHKIAIKYELNNYSVWVDGVEVATDTLASVFPIGTLDNISFDRGDGSFKTNSKIRTLAVYNTTLTDLQLETLTSYTSFIEMANALNYTIK